MVAEEKNITSVNNDDIKALTGGPNENGGWFGLVGATSILSKWTIYAMIVENVCQIVW